MSQVIGSPGQVLAGRYRLTVLLGRGGMGCVWRAEHLSLGTPVAIKLIHPSVAERRGMLGRFLREAQAAARLRSVNVVQILDHGVDEGVPYIAMECLEGESLAQRLARERKLGPAATALVFAGVCRALTAAHRAGIVHRDLKPDNIFIARDEAGPIVKVLDFGIAKVLQERATSESASDPPMSQRTESGEVLGTPRYMSPEQARAHKTLDGRSDLWALAVIAFQCLTGRLPFDAEVITLLVMQICADPIPTPSSVAEVPPGFDAWFARAMQREPEARFQTVREFADALADVLTPEQRWLETAGDGSPSDRSGPRPEVPADTPASPETQAETGASLTQTGTAVHPPRPRVFLGAAAAAVLVAAMGLLFRVLSPGGAALVSTAASPTASVVAPVIAPSFSATASPTVTPIPVANEPRRVFLVVLPTDASVEVDGVKVPSPDGVVQITGKLGGLLRVRVFKGKIELERDVVITEAGALPPKIDLSARPQKPRKPDAPRVDE